MSFQQLFLLFCHIMVSIADSSRYHAYSSPATYDDTVNDCKKLGYYLPSYENGSDIAQVNYALKNENLKEIWLPYRKRELNVWTWITGVPAKQSLVKPSWKPRSRCGIFHLRDSVIEVDNCSKPSFGYICSGQRKCGSESIQFGDCFQIERTYYTYGCDVANWYQARIQCRRLGMDLAVIDSPTIQRRLHEEWFNKRRRICHEVWIGLRKEIWEPDFNARPNSSVSEVDLIPPWGPDQPNNDGDCALLAKNENGHAHWKAVGCTKRHSRLCVKPNAISGEISAETTELVGTTTNAYIEAVVGNNPRNDWEWNNLSLVLTIFAGVLFTVAICFCLLHFKVPTMICRKLKGNERTGEGNIEEQEGNAAREPEGNNQQNIGQNAEGLGNEAREPEGNNQQNIGQNAEGPGNAAREPGGNNQQIIGQNAEGPGNAAREPEGNNQQNIGQNAEGPEYRNEGNTLNTSQGNNQPLHTINDMESEGTNFDGRGRVLDSLNINQHLTNTDQRRILLVRHVSDGKLTENQADEGYLVEDLPVHNQRRPVLGRHAANRPFSEHQTEEGYFNTNEDLSMVRNQIPVNKSQRNDVRFKLMPGKGYQNTEYRSMPKLTPEETCSTMRQERPTPAKRFCHPRIAPHAQQEDRSDGASEAEEPLLNNRIKIPGQSQSFRDYEEFLNEDDFLRRTCQRYGGEDFVLESHRGPFPTFNTCQDQMELHHLEQMSGREFQNKEYRSMPQQTPEERYTDTGHRGQLPTTRSCHDQMELHYLEQVPKRKFQNKEYRSMPQQTHEERSTETSSERESFAGRSNPTHRERPCSETKKERPTPAKRVHCPAFAHGRQEDQSDWVEKDEQGSDRSLDFTSDFCQSVKDSVICQESGSAKPRFWAIWGYKFSSNAKNQVEVTLKVVLLLEQENDNFWMSQKKKLDDEFTWKMQNPCPINVPEDNTAYLISTVELPDKNFCSSTIPLKTLLEEGKTVGNAEVHKCRIVDQNNSMDSHLILHVDIHFDVEQQNKIRIPMYIKMEHLQFQGKMLGIEIRPGLDQNLEYGATGRLVMEPLSASSNEDGNGRRESKC